MIKEILLTSSIFGLIPAVSYAASCIPADMVLTGGTVYTVNDVQPTAEAVVTLGSKIIFVGDAIGAQRYACGDAKIIDMSGKFIFPGFIDSHVLSVYW